VLTESESSKLWTIDDKF